MPEFPATLIQLPLLNSADRRRLLTWFLREQREMPWRVNRDPYRIWVSEVMLQQTTVATVTRRFEAFISRFPDLTRLAAADEQEVLKSWEGLGYYSRARNLHRAAKMLVDLHKGEFPTDPKVWSALPGVGRYILGAVLSQAFDARLPVVEANTRRLLARLGANPTELSSPEMQRWLWQTATDMLPRKNVGDFNQAMMELGATVCAVREPKCSGCPLRTCCESFKHGLQTKIPVISRKRSIEKVSEVCAVIRRKDCVYLRRRGDTGRWAGMWEFPTRELTAPEDAFAVVAVMLRELKIDAKPESILMALQYSVTRFRITMTCVEATVDHASRDSTYDDNGRWIAIQELSNFPVRSSQRKLAIALTRPIHRELF